MTPLCFIAKKNSTPIKAFYFLLSFYRGIVSTKAYLCCTYPYPVQQHARTLWSPSSFVPNAHPSTVPIQNIRHHEQRYTRQEQQCRYAFSSSTVLHMGKPKSGSIVDSYQTVSVNCAKCKTRLFRYKKKNGTKSNLIKCYIERISEDCEGLVEEKQGSIGGDDRDPTSGSSSTDWVCPKCHSKFGRDSMIHGRPAIKLAGKKTTMTKK